MLSCEPIPDDLPFNGISVHDGMVKRKNGGNGRGEVVRRRRRGPSNPERTGNGSWGMPLVQEVVSNSGRLGKERSAWQGEGGVSSTWSRIASWKEEGVTVDDLRAGKVLFDSEEDQRAARTYHVYQDLLAKTKQVDFGDLCLLALDLFTKRPDVLARYRWRLQHILVDEFQDTSTTQHRLLKALVLGTTPTQISGGGTPPHGQGVDSRANPGVENGLLSVKPMVNNRENPIPGLGVCLFCAGDEDQHIYSWRGATTKHLHR
ncbi:unnamed protein product [Choristocarpus tenellus]